jgi:hypothetical protein
MNYTAEKRTRVQNDTRRIITFFVSTSIPSSIVQGTNGHFLHSVSAHRFDLAPTSPESAYLGIWSLYLSRLLILALAILISLFLPQWPQRWKRKMNEDVTVIRIGRLHWGSSFASKRWSQVANPLLVTVIVSRFGSPNFELRSTFVPLSKSGLPLSK